MPCCSHPTGHLAAEKGGSANVRVSKFDEDEEGTEHLKDIRWRALASSLHESKITSSKDRESKNQ